MIDGADARHAEQFREDALHHGARRQHVRHAARDAQIVFEYGERSVGKTDQIRTDHGDIDIFRDFEFPHLPAEMAAGINDLAGDDAGFHGSAFVIDIAQKKIQRGDALDQAALDGFPFGAGDDARQKIVGEDAFGALFAAVHGERNALMQKGDIGGLLPAAHLFHRQAEQHFVQRAVMRARYTFRFEHFVIRAIEPVVLKARLQQRRDFNSGGSHKYPLLRRGRFSNFSTAVGESDLWLGGLVCPR